MGTEQFKIQVTASELLETKKYEDVPDKPHGHETKNAEDGEEEL